MVLRIKGIRLLFLVMFIIYLIKSVNDDNSIILRLIMFRFYVPSVLSPIWEQVLYTKWLPP